MEKEDNVYGRDAHTEEIAAARTDGENARTKEASAVIGKFKDVDALARAYGALQSEFTRRSQRLKELEKRLENFVGTEAKKTLNADTGAMECEKDGAASVENAAENAMENAMGSGVEKLRKNAETRRVQAKAFDEFLVGVGTQNAAQTKPNEGDLPSKTADTDSREAKPEPSEASAVGKATGESPSAETTAETAKGAAKSIAGSGSAEVTEETLYEQVCRDEKLRLRIIGEYLASIGRSAAPLTVGGAGTLAAPPLKARSIGDAGSMALQYFKKPIGND